MYTIHNILLVIVFLLNYKKIIVSCELFSNSFLRKINIYSKNMVEFIFYRFAVKMDSNNYDIIFIDLYLLSEIPKKD